MKTRKKEPTTSLGANIIAGLKEALAFERGMLRGVTVTRRMLSAGSTVIDPAPAYTAKHVATLRDKLQLSQPLFAAALNVSAETVKKWEQGTREPDGAALRLLELADKHPQLILASLRVTGSDITGNAAYRVKRRRLNSTPGRNDR
jgi:putative transcriptional regulator